MDAQDDLILGVLSNYDWRDIEAYAVSISRCGFRGRKILLVWNLTQYTRDQLAACGFELQDVSPANMTVDFASEFFRHRDHLTQEFLHAHDEFRYIFWLDIRDLVVQTDPSLWMEQHAARLVIPSEHVLIKDESCNDTWLKNVTDYETYRRVREFPLLNAGTIAGTTAVMSKFFTTLAQISDWTREVIVEQAAVNVLAHEPEFAGDLFVPEMRDGFAVTGYPCNPGYSERYWGAEIPTLRDGVLYVAGTDTPYCVVHQYDRNPDWNAVRGRYAL